MNDNNEKKIDIIPTEDLIPKGNQSIQSELSNVNDLDNNNQPVDNNEINNSTSQNNIANNQMNNNMNNNQPLNNIQNNYENMNNQNNIPNNSFQFPNNQNNTSNNSFQFPNNQNNNQFNMNGTQNTYSSNKTALLSIVLIIIIVASVVTYFVVFRDSNEEIVCTNKEHGIEQEMHIYLKNNKYSKGTIKQTVDLEYIASLYDATLDDIDLSKLNICDSMKTDNIYFYYENCKQEIVGKKVNMSVDLVIKSSFNKKVENVQNFVDEMNGEGYSCTRK